MTHDSASQPDQDHDSFLDIVANIVGILIILVMVVSMRAREAPARKSEPHPQMETLQKKAANHSAIQQDVARLATETHQLEDYLDVRNQERQRLCVMLSATQEEINEKQKKLTDKQIALRKIKSEIASTKENLEHLHLEHISAITRDNEEDHDVRQIKHYPSPMGKSVFGKEVHFQLLDGRVTFLPIDSLFREAREQARQKVWKLDQLPEATEIVGPRGGFHMRYTLEKVPLPPEVRAQTGRTGFMIRSKLWELIPTSTQLGEPLEKALQDSSRLRQILARLDPQVTTITLWTYPDSFQAFSLLKQELYHLGFDAAARPLPVGVRIAGSPNGSRSTAQ
ncbi:MAG: hypothetical protein CMJ74_10905 [Planctomycetaceae bacterium]|nr:hypothetical protein [Planctomycetaceae bacterium]|tara:strand:+ start:228 stop:1241 length:1014 start_codon:yes stop_codon:yes gene_type:complete